MCKVGVAAKKCIFLKNLVKSQFAYPILHFRDHILQIIIQFLKAIAVRIHYWAHILAVPPEKQIKESHNNLHETVD